MIICLTGFMGSGKSSVGRSLAQLLNYEFIDLDHYIEAKIGYSIEDIFKQQSEEGFRAIEAEALRDVIIMHQLTNTDLVLALGGGTITIGGIRHLLLEDSTCIYLKASEKSLKERLLSDKTNIRPLLNEDFAQLLKEREAFYNLAHITVETDNKSVDEIASYIAKRLTVEEL